MEKPLFSLRQAADTLDIVTWKALRLGRYIGLDPYLSMIPAGEVYRMALTPDVDDRYRALREWVLTHHIAGDESPLTPDVQGPDAVGDGLSAERRAGGGGADAGPIEE